MGEPGSPGINPSTSVSNTNTDCTEYRESLIDRILGVILGKTATVMKMSDETWLRHANPWSFATRLPLLLLITITCWSRVWIGWFSLIPLGVIIAWTYLNPRVFPKPRSTRNWISKGVFGERILVTRE